MRLARSATRLQHSRSAFANYAASPHSGPFMRRYLPLNLDVALLILRLALALVLLYHGLPKVMNFGQTVSNFSAMHIPVPTLATVIAVLAEVGGGILLLLGIAVDLAGLLVAIDMLGAIATVHLPN